jgi:hypothetical protein
MLPRPNNDSPAGRQLLIDFGPVAEPTPPIMDQAYKEDDTRQLALDLGYVPVLFWHQLPSSDWPKRQIARSLQSPQCMK